MEELMLHRHGLGEGRWILQPIYLLILGDFAKEIGVLKRGISLLFFPERATLNEAI